METEDEGEGILVEEDFGGGELLCVVSMWEMAAQTKDKNLFMTGVSNITITIIIIIMANIEGIIHSHWWW